MDRTFAPPFGKFVEIETEPFVPDGQLTNEPIEKDVAKKAKISFGKEIGNVCVVAVLGVGELTTFIH